MPNMRRIGNILSIMQAKHTEKFDKRLLHLLRWLL